MRPWIQSSGRSSSKAEPDVTGVYRRVKSRKGAKNSPSNISIENSDSKTNKQIADKSEKSS
jgi:hypothetical protein